MQPGLDSTLDLILRGLGKEEGDAPPFLTVVVLSLASWLQG
ncbi:hypothetical protein [Cryobacterium sp. GrIS_2_6]|nr:hypothetical protein [Cryobacterium psychrotolerans]